MEKIILFGAGNNAKSSVDYVLKQFGQIACFCDNDDRKIGNDCYGYPVISVEEALVRYPSYAIYVTPFAPIKYEIFEELTKKYGIDRIRIANYDRYEVRIVCEFLDSFMGVHSEMLFHCCFAYEGMNNPPSTKIKDDYATSIADFIEAKETLNKKINKAGNIEVCKGCPSLKKQYASIDSRAIKLRTINLEYVSPCQLDCIYCKVCRGRNQLYDDGCKFAHNLCYHTLFKVLRESELLTDSTIISYAAGEITILPNLDVLLKETMPYPKVIATNALIYDRAIAELPRVIHMSVSVDAGTRETYAKVKGKDAFDLVWKNIKLYKASGIKMICKYIFIPENSNEADVDGFIERACDIGVEVEIAMDFYRKEWHNPELIRYIERMIKLCNKHGVEFSCTENLLGDRNMRDLSCVLS